MKFVVLVGIIPGSSWNLGQPLPGAAIVKRMGHANSVGGLVELFPGVEYATILQLEHALDGWLGHQNQQQVPQPPLRNPMV